MSKYKHFLLVLGFIPLLIIFQYIESSITPLYTMHTRIDEQIPFIPLFVIPYLIWFPYMACAVLYTGVKNLEAYYQLVIGLFLGMGIAYIIFYLFPNNQDLRPLVYDKDFFSQLVHLIQTIDSNTNVFPSIHVINAIIVDDTLREMPSDVMSGGAKRASHALMIIICISTLFIKQHSILDVLAGVIVAFIIHVLYQHSHNVLTEKWKVIK